MSIRVRTTTPFDIVFMSLHAGMQEGEATTTEESLVELAAGVETLLEIARTDFSKETEEEQAKKELAYAAKLSHVGIMTMNLFALRGLPYDEIMQALVNAGSLEGFVKHLDSLMQNAEKFLPVIPEQQAESAGQQFPPQATLQ